MMLHNKMLSIAAKEVGVKEPSGEDKYIKWYNSVYKTGFNMSTPPGVVSSYPGWQIRQVSPQALLNILPLVLK